MSNTNILQLPVAVSVSGAEWIPLVQGETTKRAQSSLIGDGPALSVQDANTVFAGPTTGIAAGATFRALVLADLPTIPAAGITVGSTVISSGTTTRILYDNAGVLGEYTLSGSGTAVVMATSPSLTTPTLGVATATTINKLAITTPASGSTLTIADSKTLTVSNTLTFTGTDGSTLNVGTGGTLGTAAYQNTGTSGATVPLLNGANTWSSAQTFSGNLNFSSYTPHIKWPGIQGDFVCGPTADGFNTWLGIAGNFTVTGAENIGIGYTVMNSLTTGTANVAIGGGANLPCTTGEKNVAVGRHALRNNVVGSNNVAIGEAALDGFGSDGGVQNVAVGANALLFAGGANTDNTAVGFRALLNNTTGKYNSALGSYAMGGDGVGGVATGNYSVAVGYSSLAAVTTGAFNTAVGADTTALLTTGSNNTHLGWRAGYDCTTGSGNLYVGSFDSAGSHVTTGSNNIFIGNDVYNGVSRTGSSQLNIGNLIFGQAVGTAGSLSTGTIGIGIAASTTAILTLAAGTTAKAPLTLTSGTNLTSAVAGATEFDGVQFYKTIDTSSGRGAVPVEQYVHLASAGSAITTIANFFGTTSNIALVASAYYIIDIEAFFLKTTADTVVWTLTNSAAPTSQNIYYEMSPITGLVAPPGTATMLVGQVYNDTTAALTVTTGTLTTAVNHYARFKIWLKNGTGTSLKIQATATSGSVTPGINSYWRARRVSPNNIGTFAA